MSADQWSPEPPRTTCPQRLFAKLEPVGIPADMWASFWNWNVSHTGHAYSKTGHMTFVYFTNSSTTSFIPLDWPRLRISDNVVSSMNLCVRHCNFKASIGMMKIIGPSHLPCGIPPYNVSLSDRIFPIRTSCCRSSRNEYWVDPLNYVAWKAKLYQPRNNQSMINVVKRFRKVNKHSSDRLAVIKSHVPPMSEIDQGVVVFGRLLMAPNCRGSSLYDETTDNICCPTTHSSCLTNVAVREIGIRSSSIALWESVVTSFHADGTALWVK